MTKDDILADLRGIFGRKTLLSPADIAGVVSQSEGAQAVARHRGRFDIPVRSRGRNVYVSIYDLADWLHAAETPSAPEPSAEADKPRKPRTPPPSSVPGKPRRASLGAAILFARKALEFDMELLASLEALSLEAEARKTDRKRPRKVV